MLRAVDILLLSRALVVSFKGTPSSFPHSLPIAPARSSCGQLFASREADPVEPAEDALPLRRLFSPSLAERERLGPFGWVTSRV